jgi:DNA-binding MarR family transcriptional regulator
MTLVSPSVVPRYDALNDVAKTIDGLDPDSVRVLVEILAFADQLERSYDANLASYGLSQGRLYALMHVANAGREGLAPAELADRLGVTRATVTGLIDGLERDGLVRRLQRSDDRRRWTVRCTREGGDKLDGMLPDHCKRIAAAMAGLAVDEKRSLISLLAKLGTTVGELDAGA